MRKNKNEKKDNTVKLASFEKKFIRVGAFMMISLWALSFFGKISLSSINIEVERLKKNVKSQEETNQGLAMKINELASLENINVVANESGLAYNNGNIRIVTER